MGHFCRVCGRIRAHEDFTGCGHRVHVCKECQRMPREKIERMERLGEIHGFLHQSNISGKNLKRLGELVDATDADVAALAALIRDIARVLPRKRNRWLNLTRRHPELFERALDLLGVEFFSDLLAGYGDFESPVWKILEEREAAQRRHDSIAD